MHLEGLEPTTFGTEIQHSHPIELQMLNNIKHSNLYEI